MLRSPPTGPRSTLAARELGTALTRRLPGSRRAGQDLLAIVGPGTLLAAALAIAYLIGNPASADLAAQSYRTWLVHHAGFTIFDVGWYSGHHVPGYSILYPPLAAALGTRMVGALAAVAAAWLFERLVMGLRPARPGARLASIWFGLATISNLMSGRLTFALGLALALATVLALARRRLVLAGVLGMLTALGSPVAAAFLALALVVWGVHERRPWATAALLVATAGPVITLDLAFPEGGDFPFVASAFWPALATTVILGIKMPRREWALRGGVALYALLLIVSVVLSTAMGGNASRLGALLAGPLAALTLWPRRRWLIALTAPALLYWQLQTPIDDWTHASADPAIKASFYTGMREFLTTRPGAPFRIEIPFTDDHWEAVYVAGGTPPIALARGWERQLDRKVNGLFYAHRYLTAARYHAWLQDNAIAYVALPLSPIDYSGAQEARVVRSRPPFLREVYRDAHWRIFAVTDAAPLADGGARVTRMDADVVDLDVPRAGRIVLRVRYTPYWKVLHGAGCVAPAGDWTALTIRRPGRVQLRAQFSLSRIHATSPRC